MGSAFFTILYSMEWGKQKAEEWLSTFVLSFFQSVIVVQPIKVRITHIEGQVESKNKFR
jgi:hypothetical protein